MGYLKNNLTRFHGISFVLLLAGFTLWTYLITSAGVDKGQGHDARVLYTTLGTISGPLTGAIAREWQGCCLRFSLGVMAYGAPILLLGVLLQFVRLPDRAWAAALRMSLWISGWLIWFLGGIVSFLHALS
jgi:hypothetical protein